MSLSQAFRDSVTIKKEKGSEKVAVIADGYFVLIVPKGRTSAIFGTGPRNNERHQVERKILAYIQYWKSRKYEARYKAKSIFRVLTVTKSMEHLATVKGKTKEACKESQSPELAEFFLFTTLVQVTPEKVLHSPLWQAVGDTALHSLIA